MPLDTGSGHSAIGRNISTEESAGKKPKQAIAIALSEARRHGADIPAPKSKPPGPPKYRDGARLGARLTHGKLPHVVLD